MTDITSSDLTSPSPQQPVSSNALVSQFKALPVDDQIAILGQMYDDIAESLPSIVIPSTASKPVEDVVKRVLAMRESGQLQFLQDVLSDVDRNEVALDIHPTKALLELIPGDSIEPPISEYEALEPSDRLFVWYRLARQMGDDFIAMPSDYALSDAAKELMQSIQSIDSEAKVAFLIAIV